MNPLSTLALESVCGGAARQGIDPNVWKQVQDQAGAYCPTTVKSYRNVDPATITKPKANEMMEGCLQEMGSFYGAFARPKMEQAIGQAFPKQP